MKTGASFSRGNSKQDYETPPDFRNAVQNRFGLVCCDLAARADNHFGQTWIDPETDTFSVDWHKRKGLLWLNPEYRNIAPYA